MHSKTWCDIWGCPVQGQEFVSVGPFQLGHSIILYLEHLLEIVIYHREALGDLHPSASAALFHWITCGPTNDICDRDCKEPKQDTKTQSYHSATKD